MINYKFLSFILGILTVVLLFLIYYTASAYAITNIADEYNNIFCL